MNRIIVSQRPKAKSYEKRSFNKQEFVGFVADQFKKLSKKNIKIPIQLYHL